jgi:hypothetical protein
VLEENTSTNSFVVVLCHFYEVAEGYKEVPKVNKQESSEMLEGEFHHSLALLQIYQYTLLKEQ